MKNRESKPEGTPVYAREHKRGLTLPQQSAIDLLAGGKTDTETAELLKLSRTTVTKWRLYDPLFQATLNQRRAEVWASGIDRLRSLIPKALDILAQAIESGHRPSQMKAAGQILRLAQLPSGSAEIGSTDAEAIVRQIVEQRRQQLPNTLEALIDERKGLPPLARQMEETWQELEYRANEPDEADG